MKRLLPAALLFVAACSSATTTGTTVTPRPPTTSPPPTSAPSTSTSQATTTTTPATTTTVQPKATTVTGLLGLGRPIVLAHGGGEDQFPHSTPYGYAESVKAGVDMLDFDVQLTKDGVLVVQHDDTVERTTNGVGNIADMTYAELLQLDNAYWWSATCTCKDQPEAAYTLRGIRTGDVPPPVGHTADDFVIPRFSDIVQRFPTIPLNIEIKGNGAPAVAAATELAKELTELGRTDAAVVTSFDDSIVDTFHALAPTIEVTPGLNLSAGWVLSRTALPAGMRILQLPPKFGETQVISPQLITDSHAAGYLIWIWPNDRALENLDSYRQMLADGLDGLNINFPADGVAAVGERTP
jgi:glycerophosphoryl diester phosphodiesterase